jgi:hypothetical protein
MTDADIINKLKQELIPRGSSELVRLFLKDSFYVRETKIKKLIKEIESINIKATLGVEPSELEKLGLKILLDSAYISDLLI